MDDHLFLNLRTVCSRLVTVGEMKISYFLHFFYPSPSTIATSHSTIATSHSDRRERREVGGRERERENGKKKIKKFGKSSGRGADVRPHLALFSVCDKRRRFLHLADRSIFCFKSACLPSPPPTPFSSQAQPPPALLSLGRTSWQLSHSRCFTDEERPPLPRRPFPFSFPLPLTC